MTKDSHYLISNVENTILLLVTVVYTSAFSIAAYLSLSSTLTSIL